jgi:ubiquinone/menaquinone biosynthesis C-methylase UbiE
VKHIHAIDISSKMVEIARAKAEAGGVENVTFEQATLDALDVPDGTYDAVMGHSILHLLESRDEAIAEVHRLLKPGGVFVSSTACIGDFMSIFKVIAPIGRFLGLLPLVKVFKKKDLDDSLTAAGFTIEYQWQPGKSKGVLIVAKKAA